MKMPIYTVWGDPAFYAYATGFAAALFALIYSTSRWIELKNEAHYHDDLPPLPPNLAAAPAEAPAAEEFHPAQDLAPLEERPAGSAPALAEAVSRAEAAAPAADGQADLEAWLQELPAEAQPADAEKTVVIANMAELAAQAQAEQEPAAIELPAEEAPAAVPAAAPEEERPGLDLPAEAPAPAAAAPGCAEDCVRGIYERLAGMNARLSAIEASVSQGDHPHFAVKFLEGVLEDFDTLSKEKIKARVNYLIADLKESRQRAGN